jgi:DNA mismatch repair protein MLH1
MTQETLPSICNTTIAKLPDHVIRKIAAGEVIQRPCNAVKELLENAIDANSTQIQFIIQDGGLSRITVIDNGDGIYMQDMPLLCQRHVTSKLKTFEDLYAMETFGFRGEALSSMTQVARVSITSLKRTGSTDNSCAYTSVYENGSILPGYPMPCAGNPGTVIHITGMFSNQPLRRSMFSNGQKSITEEYHRILHIVSLYAIHYAGRVGITCKRLASGSGTSNSIHDDLCSIPLSGARDLSACTLDSIRIIYGQEIARELFPIKLSDGSPYIGELGGFISKTSYHLKKPTWILFINHRLVECKAIKQAVYSVYESLLPKKTWPFVYLSLCVPFSRIDVNMHPTKESVLLLDEISIVQLISSLIQKSLETFSVSKTFSTGNSVIDNTISATSSTQDAPSPLSPYSKIRQKDPQTKSLLSFTGTPQTTVSKNTVTTPKIQVQFTSIHNIKQELYQDQKTESMPGKDIDFTTVSFIGTLDLDLSLLLFQYQSTLYMASWKVLNNTFVYQKILNCFCNLELVPLDPPIPISKLLGDSSTSIEVGQRFSRIMDKFQNMFKEYFSIEIRCTESKEFELVGLPMIYAHIFIPDLRKLSKFFAFISRSDDDPETIDWSDEQKCFQGLIKAITDLFQLDETIDLVSYKGSKLAWWLEHGLFGAFKQQQVKSWFRPIPLENVTYGTQNWINPLTDLKSLYKIFERC